MVDVAVNFTLGNEEPVNAEFQVQPDVTFTADISIEPSARRHEELINRDLPDQHPIGAITGLTDILSNKQNILIAGEGITIVDNVISSTQSNVQWGNITGSLNNQTDLKNVLDSKANISDIPTVGNATLTIQKNNTTIDTFTANATVDKIINLAIPTNASDINALPDNTKYGANISLTINSSTYVITAQLKDQNGDNLGIAQTIDLPLESVVVNGSYDNTDKKIVLTLQNGTLIDVPVGDLVAGLQTEITSSNKLSASLVSGLATVATSGSYDDLSNKPTIPTVNNATLTIQKNSTNVATFAANASSDVTANISVPTKVSDLTNDRGFITGITSSDVTTALGYTPYNSTNPNGYITSSALVGYATQTWVGQQGYITSSALAPYVLSSSLATVATSGSYNDLTNKPTIPAAQVNSDWNAVSGVAQILNKPTIPIVNNPTITFTQGGTTKGTITLNQSTNQTINFDAGGGGGSYTAGDGINITNNVISVDGEQTNTIDVYTKTEIDNMIGDIETTINTIRGV